MTHLARTLPALALATALVGGCAGLDLLSPKEKPLPGERRAVLSTAAEVEGGGTAAPGPAASAADWPQPGGNAANAPGHVALAGAGATPAWRTRAVEGLARKNVRASAPPVASGGGIYVYDASGAVTALSAGGGRSWSASLAPAREGSRTPGGGVAVAGNAVVATTGFGEIVALDPASGSRLWSYRLDAPARSAPTAAGGKVYVVSAGGTLHAVNLADGSGAWTYAGVADMAGVLSGASPAVSGNIVVVPYTSGEIIALDAASGKMKWADAVTRSTRRLAVSGLSDVAASPVVADGVVYAAGVAGRMIAVRLANGERLWEQGLGSASTPAVSGNAVYLVDLEDNMVALERRTGKVLWRTPLPTVREKKFFSVWTGPTLAGGVLWAVSNNGRLIGVDAANGTIVSERALPGPAISRPIAAAGQLLVLTADGSLSAFR